MGNQLTKINQHKGTVVALDMGTSTIAVQVSIDGKLQTIKLGVSKDTLDAITAIRWWSKDNKFAYAFGEAAYEVRDDVDEESGIPDHVVLIKGIKSIFRLSQAADFKKLQMKFPSITLNKAGEIRIKVMAQDDKTAFTLVSLVEIYKQFAQYVMGIICKKTNIKVPDVLVLSHPNYNTGDKERLKQINQVIGAKKVITVQESLAAGLFNGIKEKNSNRYVIVIDMGAGTTDITVIEYKGDLIYHQISFVTLDNKGGDVITDELLKLSVTQLIKAGVLDKSADKFDLVCSFGKTLEESRRKMNARKILASHDFTTGVRSKTGGKLGIKLPYGKVQLKNSSVHKALTSQSEMISKRLTEVIEKCKKECDQFSVKIVCTGGAANNGELLKSIKSKCELTDEEFDIENSIGCTQVVSEGSIYYAALSGGDKTSKSTRVQVLGIETISLFVKDMATNRAGAFNLMVDGKKLSDKETYQTYDLYNGTGQKRDIVVPIFGTRTTGHKGKKERTYYGYITFVNMPIRGKLKVNILIDGSKIDVIVKNQRIPLGLIAKPMKHGLKNPKIFQEELQELEDIFDELELGSVNSGSEKRKLNDQENEKVDTNNKKFKKQTKVHRNQFGGKAPRNQYGGKGKLLKKLTAPEIQQLAIDVGSLYIINKREITMMIQQQSPESLIKGDDGEYTIDFELMNNVFLTHLQIIVAEMLRKRAIKKLVRKEYTRKNQVDEKKVSSASELSSSDSGSPSSSDTDDEKLEDVPVCDKPKEDTPLDYTLLGGPLFGDDLPEDTLLEVEPTMNQLLDELCQEQESLEKSVQKTEQLWKEKRRQELLKTPTNVYYGNEFK